MMHIHERIAEINRSDLRGASRNLEDCMMGLEVGLSSQPRSVMSQRLLCSLKPCDRPEEKLFGLTQDADNLCPMDNPLNVLASVYAEKVSLDDQLSNINNIIAKIDMKRVEGKIHLGWAAFREERDCLLRKQLVLLADTAVLRANMIQIAETCANTIKAGIIDLRYSDVKPRPTFANAVWRHYPQLINSVKYTPSQDRLDRFRDELLLKYDSVKDDNEHMAWCPILGAYCPLGIMAPAHIANPDMTEPVLQALFGNDEKHSWNPKNALFICKAYKQLLDQGKAAIIILTGHAGKQDYLFMLLTDEIGRPQASVWDNDLHGRRLNFRNDFLPASKYIHFKLAMSALCRYRMNDDRSSAADDLRAYYRFSQTFWAMPGPRLRNPILYKFSQQFGCLSSQASNVFWGARRQQNLPRRLSAADEDYTTTQATILSFGAASVAMEEYEIDKQTKLLFDSESENEGQPCKRTKTAWGFC